MGKLYWYRVNIGDNDHVKVRAHNLAEVEKKIGTLSQFDTSMINSVIREEEKKMTKQERIREGLAHKLAELEGFSWEWTVKEKFEDEWLGKADEVLKWEDSQDVVIKVDAAGYALALRDMAGAVEPIIKGEEND